MSFFKIGAHLKDLDGGLIDFYSRRGSDVILLCWKEGETEVGYWHSPAGGLPKPQAAITEQ